ncbi:MAG: hypothetical protein JXQ87_07535 [Bacteroidia bacterium]
MKLFKIFMPVLALIGIVGLTQCSTEVDYDSDSIAGVVKLNTGDIANGAIVYLSTEPNAANVVFSSVAGTNGAFSFAGLTAGTYYLSAKYNSANQNNANKRPSFNFTTGADVDVEFDGSTVTQDLELIGNVENGNAIVDMEDGWVFDNTHTNVNFEFDYDAENASFKGLFGEVGFDAFKFDEAAPANTVIDAWVYLPSVETGSPTLAPNGHGRDDINGCLMGTFGVEPREADTLTDGSGYYREDAATTEDHTGSGYARLTSKSVMAYGDGFMATCDILFRGQTSEVKMYFKYIEGFEAESRSGDPTQFSSFEGFFDFAPKADHGAESGHLLDEIVTVDLGIQWTKKL